MQHNDKKGLKSRKLLNGIPNLGKCGENAIHCHEDP